MTVYLCKVEGIRRSAIEGGYEYAREDHKGASNISLEDAFEPLMVKLQHDEDFAPVLFASYIDGELVAGMLEDTQFLVL